MGLISIVETIPSHGRFRYITRGIKPTESPHYYHLPPTADFGDIRSLPIQDIRSSLELGHDSPFKLNKQGFTARHSATALSSVPYTHTSWNDESLLRQVYIPEIETLLLEVTGGKTVFTDSLVMRNNLHTEVDGLAATDDSVSVPVGGEELRDFPNMVGFKADAGGSPAPKVHLDLAPNGARAHIRKYHVQTAKLAAPIIDAEERLLACGISPADLKDHYDGPRWAMFSVWRPLRTVRRDPLALSDCRTFPKEDYITLNILIPTLGQNGSKEESHYEESFLAYGSYKHEWYWISNQTPDEVLIIQLFDSEAERNGLGVAGGVMHSSVDIEGTEMEDPRESLEVRCVVMW